MVSLHPAIIDFEKHLIGCYLCRKRFDEKDETTSHCDEGQKLFDNCPKSYLAE